MPHFFDEESLHLSFDTLPVAKEWEVGTEYEIKLLVRQTSMHESGASFAVIMAEGHEVTQQQEEPEEQSGHDNPGHQSAHGGVMRKKKKRKKGGSSIGKPYNA